MTAPTGEAAPTEGSAPAPRQRPVRRALDDLGLVVTAEHVERIAADEPAWLADDRRAAFEQYTALPGESNRLYTPYIDLRAAQLADAALAIDGPATAAPSELTEGTDVLAELVEGRDVAIELSDAACRAGVTVRLLHADLDAVRDVLTRLDALPAADKFAQLTRAAWTQGLLIDVPAGVQLDHPIVVRWVLGEGDRALLTRTLVRLGENAHASVVEELVPSDQVTGVGAQAFFAGTAEVMLGRIRTPWPSVVCTPFRSKIGLTARNAL